jgi:AcrR family transcriptional regulator
VGYKHDEQELRDAAVAEAMLHGLSQLTYGRLAKRVGITDRMLVYYFPTKSHLIEAVVVSIGTQLMAELEEAIGPGPLSEQAVLDAAWPHLASRRADPIFAIFFELTGLAAVGVEPFAELATKVVKMWVAWLAPRLAADTARERHDAALAVVARIDGLLLLRQLLGAEAANRAAAALGVSTTRRKEVR